MIAYIYYLVEIGDGTPKYVGKSKQPTVRLQQHLTKANNGARSHVHNWLRSILSRGSKVELHLLGAVPEKEWKDKERAAVTFYRQRVPGLCNQHPGGQGPTEFAEQSKQKIRKALTGKCASQETIRKLRESHLGHKPSRETIEKRRASNTGKTRSAETKLKTKLSLLRVWESEEYRCKVAQSRQNKNYKHSEEVRAKLRGRNPFAKFSAEERRAIIDKRNRAISAAFTPERRAAYSKMMRSMRKEKRALQS